LSALSALSALLLVMVFGTSAFPQDRGTIRCDPGMDKVPSWTAPGRAFVSAYLNCGQMISIAGLERGYAKIQIGENFSYVDARFVRLSYTEEQPAASQEPQGGSAPGKVPAMVAAQRTAPLRSPVPLKPRRHEGGLAFELSHIEYEEPDIMNNKGLMRGASGDYTYRPGNLMFKADGRFSFGDVDYWSQQTGSQEDIRDYNFETRFSFGYDLVPSTNVTLAPFLGLGYRYLFDGSNKTTTTTGAMGYDRKSNYLYSPLGMEAVLPLGGGWSLGMAGEYDLFWHGWQYSEFAQAELGMTAMKNDQNDGWGARGSVKIIKNLGRIDFTIEPYFRYWNIEDSDLDVNLYYDPYFGSYFYSFGREPLNNTKEWGAKIGIRF